MKIGLSLRTTDLNLIDDYLKEMTFGGRLCNISHFEINYISDNLGYDWRDKYLNGIKKRIIDNNLSASIHFPSFNVSETNLKIQQVILEEFIQMLDFIKDLPIKNIIVHPGYLDYYETPKISNKMFIERMKNDLQTSFQYSSQFLKKMSSLAKSYDKNILLENLPLPRCITKDCYDLISLKNLINEDNIKFVLDTGHLNITGKDLSENIEKLSHELFETHVHDNNSEYDQHSIPGTGTVDWSNYRKSIEKIDFNGIHVIELNDCSIKSIIKSHDFLLNLFKL